MQSLHRISASDLQRFLETPEELLRESEEMQMAVASFGETPQSLLEILVNSDYSSVVEASRLHVNFAGTLRDYQEVVSQVMRNLDLGQNDRLAVELMQFAPVAPCFLSEWVPERRLIQGLQNEYMPLRYRLQLLERLSQSDKLEARLVVGESLEAPVSLLDLLAGDLELAVRLTVECNENCPSEVIELVKSQHDVANDWDADVERLRELGESGWGWIRLTVAQNPFAPEDALMKLARDEEFRIRLAVAKNPNVSAEVLAVLVENSGKEIQSVVVKHPNTGEETLHKLFAGYKDEIAIRENLPASILEQFYREKAIDDKPLWNHKYVHILVNQPNTPTRILAELADVDLEVLITEKQEQTISPIRIYTTLDNLIEQAIWLLENIAKHPQVSEDILSRLAEYSNPKVKLAVACNQRTLAEIKDRLWQYLASHSDDKIKAEIAENSTTSPHILEIIGQNEFYSIKLLREIRRVFSTEFTANYDLIQSLADQTMYYFQQEILQLEGIYIDADKFMEVIETPKILEHITNSLSWGKFDDDDDDDKNNQINWLLTRRMEVFPEIPEILHQKIVDKIIKILELIVDDVKHSDSQNSIAVKLIGNPNTSIDLLESLKNQLVSNGFEDGVIYALACNSQLPQQDRMEYYQQILSSNSRYDFEIAHDSRTPDSIFEQLYERKHLIEYIASNPATPEYLLRKIAVGSDEYLCTILAKNPSTPIDLLYRFLNEKLDNSFYSEESILELVIDNRGLPALERYRLIIEKKNAEIAAKAHTILVKRTDNPNVLAQVVETGNREVKETIACGYNTPAFILERLALDADEMVRAMVAVNDKTPISILRRLGKDTSEVVRSCLVDNPNLPSNFLSELAQSSTPKIIQDTIARSNYSIPRDVLLQLLQTDNQKIRSTIACSLNTPVDILIQLTEDKENEVKINALSNPNIPTEFVLEALLNIEFDKEKDIQDILWEQGNMIRNTPMFSDVLDRLSYHPDILIRRLLSKFPTASATTLERLAFDNDRLIRENLVENPSTPASILIELAKRDRLTTRDGCYHTISNKIAMRKDAPLEALEYIVRQPVVPVVCEALRNLNTPDSALEWLVENQDDEIILSAVAKHPNITPDILTGLSLNESVKVREVVASQQKCPLSILETLACDSAVKVKQEVAANPNTPNHILESFSQSENSAIRTRVASNPNLSTIILKRLANDEKVEVRREVAKNPNTPQNIRESLQNLLLQPQTQEINPTLISLPRIYNPKTDDLSILLTEYAQSNNAFVRLVTLLHPITPQEILTQGANSALWLERYAVAQNESTPLEIRQILAADGNRIVRAAANNNL